MFSVLIFAGCDKINKMVEGDTNTEGKNKTVAEKTPEKKNTPGTKLTEDGFVVADTDGTAKETPETGKANVQGKALYDGKPAADVDVQLCEKFSTFSGCGGKTYKTKTDENGEYLFKNVEPMDYGSLLVSVFKTRSSIFASTKFGITAAKYKVEADETFFAPVTNIYKFDLKAENPKSKAKVDAKDFEIKWDAYESAAYYKISMFAKDPKVSAPYVNEEVKGESLKVDKPLTNGEYRLKIEAYNGDDIKLAQLDKDIEFTVTGGEEPKVDTNTETK